MQRCEPGGVWLLSGFGKPLTELLNTARGIDEFLLSGKERMAIGANFEALIWLRGTHQVLGTTSTRDGGQIIVGMDSLFHITLLQ